MCRPARRGRRRPGVGERAPAGATLPGPLGPRPGPRRAPPRRGETRPGPRARPPTKLERGRREAGPPGSRPGPLGGARPEGRGRSARVTPLPFCIPFPQCLYLYLRPTSLFYPIPPITLPLFSIHFYQYLYIYPYSFLFYQYRYL